MSSALADATSINTATPLSLPEQLASRLGHDIVAGLYTKGQRLIETDLAARYMVSRGPVRDAFQLLERRRFITIEPRKGAYVREISLSSIADIFNVRAVLFSTAIRFMAQLNTGEHVNAFIEGVEKLHILADDPDTTWMAFLAGVNQIAMAVVRGSGSELIAELLNDFGRNSIWASLWVKPIHFETQAARQLEARHITATLDAVVRGDVEAAERAVRRMMEYNRDTVIRSLAEIRQEQVDPSRMLALSDRSGLGFGLLPMVELEPVDACLHQTRIHLPPHGTAVGHC